MKIKNMSIHKLAEFHAEEGFFDADQQKEAELIVYGYVQDLLNDGEIGYWVEEYGEPGYTSEKPILLGNWNNFEKDILNLVEEYFELEWDDEWVVIYRDGKSFAYRNSPNGYDWKPSFYMDEDGELYIEEDMDRETVISLFGITYHYNTNLKAIPFDLNLEEFEFKKVNQDRFENGWHPGQTDDPQQIIDELFKKEENQDKTYVFTYDSSQFYTSFDLWETDS